MGDRRARRLWHVSCSPSPLPLARYHPLPCPPALRAPTSRTSLRPLSMPCLGHRVQAHCLVSSLLALRFASTIHPSPKAVNRFPTHTPVSPSTHASTWPRTSIANRRQHPNTASLSPARMHTHTRAHSGQSWPSCLDCPCPIISLN